MRFADLVRLSLQALWQQKTRACLTTLGVVFGAFVLSASLSLGQGVQETIERESHRNAFLRKIVVRPQWRWEEPDGPEEDVRVEGQMDEDKRKRLREALLAQKRMYSVGGPRVGLTRDRLQALAALPHVESVTPTVQQSGWVALGGRSEQASTCSADPEAPLHRNRLVAGEFFHNPDDRRVVVSEFLCYRLGVTDDAAVRGLVGKPIRLEFRSEPPTVGLHVYLTRGDRQAPTRQEALALEKLRRQLPASLDRFDLAAEERDALQNALKGPPRQEAEVYSQDLTVAGVVRLPTKEEERTAWESFARDADVLLPQQTAEKIFFAQKAPAQFGVDEAVVLVDREDNVKAVSGKIAELKLRPHAPIEFIERERFMFLLIFAAMSSVAAVALLVAALGIANTMLMSVLERTREIGVFKAVGAGDGTVQLIFLIEGALIGLAGGLVGLLLGWLASFPADAWLRSMVRSDLYQVELKQSLFAFPPWLVVGVVLFAVLVTTLAAVFPARRAARVNPVTALRNE